MDESPRWLYAQGRLDEAAAIVRKQLVANGKDDSVTEEQLRISLGNASAHETDCSATHKESYGVVDLFKTPRLRLRTLNVAFNW